MPAGSKRVAVIGGGAAGMMAAIFAQNEGADVVVLEKNEKAGKKIYITGKGRCNLCNACAEDELLANFPRNARFLHAAARFLPPEKLMATVEGLGCPVKVERGRRVYPVSEKASDVTRALLRGLGGADLLLHAEAAALDIGENTVRGVLLKDGRRVRADAVIVATGGLSYPATGSTGDGYLFARQAGHTVTPCYPSLVPVSVREQWVKSLTGLVLKNVRLTLWAGGKRAFSEQGEMLLTHFGISGPLALSMSAHVGGAEDVRIEIDLKPALAPEALDARLVRELAQESRKRLSTLMLGYLPSAMAGIFPSLAGIDGEKPCGQVTQKERRALAALLKRLPLTFDGLRPYSEAVVTRGGVEVKEVSPSTMMSKKVRGLFFAGEVLDVDGYTGGFNLQIAFSTGALAGRSAARYLADEDLPCTTL